MNIVWLGVNFKSFFFGYGPVFRRFWVLLLEWVFFCLEEVTGACDPVGVEAFLFDLPFCSVALDG